MHELVAVCAAVLRPSPEVWTRFVTCLDELVESADVSDDESIAVLASEFTRMRLADFESEADVEADTVREIVERVRAGHEAKLRAELNDGERRRAETEQAAADARDEAARIRAAVEARAATVATWLAGGLYGGICVVLLVGAILSLPTAWSDATRADKAWNLAWWLCVASFFVVSLFGSFTRFHVLNVFDHLNAWFLRRVRAALLPEDSQSGDA